MATAVLGMAVTVAFAVAALAQTATPYPPVEGQAQLSMSMGYPGSQVTISGGGFCANSDVDVRIVHENGTGMKTLDTTTADADGNVSDTVTIPTDTELGAHYLQLAGLGADCKTPRVLSARFVVQAAGAATVLPERIVAGGSGGQGGALARTGEYISVALMIAGALVLLGVLLLVALRVNRRGNSPA